MKKALAAVAAVLAAIALLVWVLSWFRADDAVAASAGRPWPGDLGTLDSISDRLPLQQGNEAAAKLIALFDALPKNEAVDEFAAREIARGELAIGEPPALPDVSPIRELLLNEPVVWERHGGIGDTETTAMRAMQMTMARALLASALSKARASDPAAWDDLRAVWSLARSLDAQPQPMMQTAAFSMARMINAVAWKMPLPAPAWFGELQARDAVQPLLAAFQFQAASYWKDGAQLFPTKLLAGQVEHDRLIAEELFDETKCDVNVRANELGVDLSSLWRRAFRYRAELEATANGLRVREGKPIESASRCRDGAWSFDGSTLRFSRAIPTSPPDDPMPLALRLQ